MAVDKIPFDKNGMQQYPWEWADSFHWEDNRIFSTTMTFHSYSRGRSAAGFNFKDENDRNYYMFLTDISDMIREVTLDHGKVSGKWTFVKRGTNYGVKYLGE